MSKLTPTPIIDKNGRATTVHKNLAPTVDVSAVSQPKPDVPSNSNPFESDATALLKKFGDLEFKNNNSYRDGEKETLTLKDMAIGDNAGGNCGNASRALLRAAFDSIPGDDDPELIHLETTDEGWSHTAIAVWSDSQGDYMVIDFTARQVNEDLPFPYIAPQKQWKKTIQKYAELGKLQFAEDNEWE